MADGTPEKIDPSKMLEELRELADAVCNSGATLTDVNHFAVRFEMLDEWLCAGGMLPDAWALKASKA